MASKHTRGDDRCLLLVTSALSLCYHALVAAFCTYLPQDSMEIGYGVGGYATVACVISLLGLYGTIVQNRTLVSLFSHTLLLDALVSTCARLLILELFFHTAHSQDTCYDIIGAIWADQSQPSQDVLSSPEWQHALLQAGVWCRFALGAVHVACISVLICVCAAQGTIALAVRKYGMQIGQSQESDILVDQKNTHDEVAGDIKVGIS